VIKINIEKANKDYTVDMCYMLKKVEKKENQILEEDTLEYENIRLKQEIEELQTAIVEIIKRGYKSLNNEG